MRLYATLLGLLAWAGVVTLMWRTLARQRGDAPLGRADWFVMLYLLLCPPAVVWAWSGMETALVALSWVAAWVVHLRERENNSLPWRSGLLTCAAGLLHPEGAPFIGVVLAASWLLPWRRRSLKNAAAYLAIAWGLFGLYWLWRWRYFGDFLPNTYYMKVGAHLPIRAGLKYVGRSMASAPISFYLLYLLWRDQSHWRKWSRPLATALGLAAADGLFCILVGGDYFAFQRFLLPAIPLVIFAIWTLQCRLAAQRDPKPRARRPFVEALALTLVLAVWGNFVPSLEVLEQVTFRRAIKPSIAAGRVFRRDVPRDAVIATLPIGAFGFFAENRILDMMGLTDRHIAHLDIRTGAHAAAHEKTDYAYVLGRRPEIIVELPTLFPPTKDGFYAWMKRSTFIPQQAAIYEQPALADNYQLAWLFVKKQRPPLLSGRRGLEDVGVFAYLRGDLVNQPPYRRWRTFDPVISEFPFQHWREFAAGNEHLIRDLSIGMWNF